MLQVKLLRSLIFVIIIFHARQSWQEQGSINLPGDIILGGLFPVHEKGDKSPCGRKIYNRGVQRLEAMMFAVDKINKDKNILPNITLGVNILDTCSRDTYALNQSLEFVRASLNNLDTTAYECLDNSLPKPKKNNTGPVVGVIGGSYSSVSLQVANLLRLFHIPQISPASTAKALSDKTRFDYFARTVPPDTYQSIALVDIVKSVNWSYISTIYSEGSYGENGIEVFHKEAQERNVCIATAEKVPSTADDHDFDLIIAKLKKKGNAKGVVLFTRAEDARRLLQAAKRSNMTNHTLYWIASDGWGKQQKLVEGVESVAEGAITVELQSTHVPGFDEYMKSLTPENNARNPWFEEYWEEIFECTLEKNVPLTTNQSLKMCGPHLRLNERVGYEQESKIQFVVDAVYAFALALHNLQQDLCQDQVGLCPEMAAYDGGDFYRNYLLNVSFIDLAGSEVKFDRQGDGLARYDILNYQKLANNASGYHYRMVGKWLINSLKLNLNELIWNNATNTPPPSDCSLPCEKGMIKRQQGDTCCWICDKCEDYEYVYDEFTCRDCGPGYWPYPDKLSCYALDYRCMRWDSPLAIVPMVISCLGILLTLVVVGLFIKNNDTPLVRASGRELSYMLLLGIMLCYLNTFALIARPSIYTCITQRFGVGVGFSIIYGALLTKTNRISRIFDSASKSAARPSYISPKSQMVIATSLILVQIVITLVWMIVEPPGTRFYYPDRRQVILKCKIQDMSFLCSQLYNMLLITICTIYAVKTRKIPENFNESKFIGFTMYTTCIIWLAFIPIYFGTGNSFETQITTLCVSISLSATVALVCLYSPKVYIIVFHPDKNVRKLTMNSAAYRKSCAGPSSTAGTTGTSSARGGDGASEVLVMQNMTGCGTATATNININTNTNGGNVTNTTSNIQTIRTTTTGTTGTTATVICATCSAAQLQLQLQLQLQSASSSITTNTNTISMVAAVSPNSNTNSNSNSNSNNQNNKSSNNSNSNCTSTIDNNSRIDNTNHSVESDPDIVALL
ncbi:metabotropic glutamate receptor [Chrysoperla carnea]|uniref:metabotropic glutamate receptor n=1 Tax=Chrysoperla carnea TaxID=189513 RepID=UPI001D076453|nr:metabotropic glutamate receptor [Chrysoperla carnea]